MLIWGCCNGSLLSRRVLTCAGGLLPHRFHLLTCAPLTPFCRGPSAVCSLCTCRHITVPCLTRPFALCSPELPLRTLWYAAMIQKSQIVKVQARHNLALAERQATLGRSAQVTFRSTYSYEKVEHLHYTPNLVAAQVVCSCCEKR